MVGEKIRRGRLQEGVKCGYSERNNTTTATNNLHPQKARSITRSIQNMHHHSVLSSPHRKSLDRLDMARNPLSQVIENTNNRESVFFLARGIHNRSMTLLPRKHLEHRRAIISGVFSAKYMNRRLRLFWVTYGGLLFASQDDVLVGTFSPHPYRNQEQPVTVRV